MTSVKHNVREGTASRGRKVGQKGKRTESTPGEVRKQRLKGTVINKASPSAEIGKEGTS